MSTATIRFEDGRSATLTFPEGMSDEQKMEKVMLVKQQYLASQPKVQKAAGGDPAIVETAKGLTEPPEEKGGGNFYKQAFNHALGSADILKTMATGGLGYVGGGIAGLAGALLPGEENQGTRWKDATESAITADLWTDAGKRMANASIDAVLKTKFIPKADKKNDKVGAPLRKFSHFESLEEQNMGQNFKDFVMAVSAGNPVVATAIETGLRAVPEVAMSVSPVRASSLKSMMNIRKDRNVLRDRFNDMEKSAEAAGYKLSNDELSPSIVRVAENLAPEKHAAANMDEVAQSVKDAKVKMTDDINNLYTEARKKKGSMSAKPFKDLAKEAEQDLFQRGFDINRMPLVQGILGDLANPARVAPRSVTKPPKQKLNPFTGEPMAPKPKNPKTVTLQTLDIIEQRITNALKGKKRGEYTAEDAALLDLRGRIRSQLDTLFDDAAIKGDPDAKAAWREARGAAAKKKRLFNTDTTIRNMVVKEESPEQVYRWLMGASAMGAKKQAGATIIRLKEILGDNHPSLVLIRNAALRDVLVPAFKDIPNYPQLIRNIDRLMLDNPTIVKELNIPTKELELLKRAAHTAQKVHAPIGGLMDRGWLLKTVNRIVFGHQIAKAGALVQTTHKIVDSIFKTGNLKKDEIVRHMMELDTGQPLVKPGGPVWTEIMVRGAAQDALDDREESFADQDTDR